MPGIDLLLLHAPSVYDFRARPAMYGPISDVIPSTPVFEMYPLGFVSMIGYLEQNGYHARIINLAVKMLKNPSFNVERFISKINASIIGLDLHWLAHAAGSLDIAKIIKEHHPDKPIILGGLTSTYYHEEIIEYFPQIDYILRGDTTEKPLLELVHSITKGKEPENVPNLTWRTNNGRKKINPMSFTPENIDDMWIDYGQIVKLVLRHMDLESTLPYESFMDYPFTALLTCKGCTQNCITCGGSCYTFKKFFQRDNIVMKSPEKLVEEMTIVSEYFKAPLFLIGDLRQGGDKWTEKLLEKIKEAKLDNTIAYELFDKAHNNYLKKLSDSSDSWTIEISPETHDDLVRAIMGKPYTLDQMERTIKNALSNGAEKIDIYYMVGLSGQTPKSVLESVAYNEKLLDKTSHKGKIFPFISPMAPFLDPGSIIFENPSKYGFTTLWRTLREHKEALYQPSWKQYLNYYTEWMSRNQIAETTYQAMIKMNTIKVKHGITNQNLGKRIDDGLKMAWNIMMRIDEIVATIKNQNEIDQQLQNLKQEIEDAKKSTGLAKRELRMPGLKGIRIKGAIKHLLHIFGQR
jgi:B12-binding domain/radical SAM domain protein